MGIILLRTIIIFLVLLFTLRMMGKRQLGELELSELVVAVLISDIAAHPLQDTAIPLLYGLVPVLTLFCCELLISFATLKSIRFRRFMCGKPSILIDNGKIIQSEMKRNRFSLDELTEELRKKGVVDLSTVRYAILEVDGTLNSILYATEQAVTAKDMNLSPPDSGLPVTLISDGRILHENLTLVHKSEKWLVNQVKQHGAKHVREVYLLTIDALGKIYYCPKEIRP